MSGGTLSHTLNVILGTMGGFLGGLGTSAALWVGGWTEPQAPEGAVPDQPTLIEPVRGTYGVRFSVDEVVRQIGNSTVAAPRSSGVGAITFEHPSTELESYYKITVYTEGEGVRIVFLAGGKEGLEVARELFESPLFGPEETQMLYSLLARAPANPRERMGRFDASASSTRQADLLVFVLRLTPR